MISVDLQNIVEVLEGVADFLNGFGGLFVHRIRGAWLVGEFGGGRLVSGGAQGLGDGGEFFRRGADVKPVVLKIAVARAGLEKDFEESVLLAGGGGDFEGSDALEQIRGAPGGSEVAAEVVENLTQVGGGAVLLSVAASMSRATPPGA
jgi:hypothetical protein